MKTIRLHIVFVVTIFLMNTHQVAIAQKIRDIDLVHSATDYVQSQVTVSLAGWLVIVVHSEDFKSLENDKDLAPAISSARAAEDSGVVVVMPSHPSVGESHFVFFKDASLSAHSTNRVGERKSIYINLKNVYEKFLFQEGEVIADDGTPIAGYQINSASVK